MAHKTRKTTKTIDTTCQHLDGPCVPNTKAENVEGKETYDAKPRAWEEDKNLHSNGVDEETRQAILRDILAATSPAEVREIAQRYLVSTRYVRELILEYRQERDVVADIRDMRMVEKIEALLDQFAGALTKDKLSKASVKDLSIGIGVLTDKLQVFRGKRSSDGGIRARVAWRTPDGHEMGLEIG